MTGMSGRVPVLAIRKADERFFSLKSLLMEDVENVSYYKPITPKLVTPLFDPNL